MFQTEWRTPVEVKENWHAFPPEPPLHTHFCRSSCGDSCYLQRLLMPRKSRSSGNRKERCCRRIEPWKGDASWKHGFLKKTKIVIFLVKIINQSALPLREWTSIPGKDSRDPWNIISWSTPLEHFVIWTFIGKTEIMSCREFISQITTVTQNPSGLLLLGWRSFQNGSFHWVSAERKRLQWGWYTAWHAMPSNLKLHHGPAS